jgi:hypothetical protein
MSTEPADPLRGTALAYFRANNIKGLVDKSKATANLWALFGRPEYVKPNQKYTFKTDPTYKCNLDLINWLDNYDTDDALNDLMNAYAYDVPKLEDYTIDLQTVSNPLAFNCEIANALNINLSKDFVGMISKLVGIVKAYMSIIPNQSPSVFIHPSLSAYEKVKWIISEVLPTLFIWVTELHIKRAALPIYNDSILNYITRVFLLLQAETYLIEGKKMMELRKQFITEQQDGEDQIVDFIDAINTTLSTRLDDIDNNIKNIISAINNDTNLSESEKNVTLAAIYDLRYKADKSLVDNNIYFADKPDEYNRLTTHYKQWLDNVNKDCKMVDDLTDDGSSTYVKDRVCTRLGALTRKSVTPASIKKADKYPVVPAVTSQ